jgi:hypothetical protein
LLPVNEASRQTGENAHKDGDALMAEREREERGWRLEVRKKMRAVVGQRGGISSCIGHRSLPLLVVSGDNENKRDRGLTLILMAA